MNYNEEMTWVIWVGSIWLLGYFNTEPFLWLESDASEGKIRDEKWGRHLTPLVCHSCRAQMESRRRRRNKGSSGSKDEVEVEVLQIWGTEGHQQPEPSWRSLPHGSNEDSSFADTFVYVTTLEAKRTSPSRRLTHRDRFCACVCSWVYMLMSMFTPVHVDARVGIRYLP